MELYPATGLGMVDRILEIGENTIRAQKNLTITEDYLLDHFSGYPVMPGVLMIQAVCETAGWWLKKRLDFGISEIRLVELRNVRFASFLIPGQILQIEVENKKLDAETAEFQAKGMREESVVLSLRFKVNYKKVDKILPSAKWENVRAGERAGFEALLQKNKTAS